MLSIRGDSVLSAYDRSSREGPHSPDRGHDGYRASSYSSGPCSEAPGAEYPHGAAPLHRGHLQTASWPPVSGGLDLNMVRWRSLQCRLALPTLALPTRVSGHGYRMHGRGHKIESLKLSLQC